MLSIFRLNTSTQELVNCWAHRGNWIKDTELDESKLYQYPCTSLRYATGVCNKSSTALMNKPKFHWHVNTVECASPYVQFNRSDMAQLLNSQNILVVGDSISEEFYISLMSSMFAPSVTSVPQGCNVCGHYCRGDYPEWFSHDNIHHSHDNIYQYTTFSARSVRNDAFTILQSVDEQLNFHNLEWFSLIERHNISIVIFNRGAHYEPLDISMRQINHSLSTIFNKFPRIFVIYRTTAVGHINHVSTFLSDPVSSNNLHFQERDDELAKDACSSCKDSTLPHNWGQFRSQNVAVDGFLRREYPQVLIMDIYHMTSLRTDLHPDGLHYCIPGPIDEWVVMLYNSLRVMYAL